MAPKWYQKGAKMHPTCEAKREHAGNKHNAYPKLLFHKWVSKMSRGMVSNMKIPQVGPEHICIHMHACAHTRTQMYAYVYICTHMRTCAHICRHMYTAVHICTYKHMNAHICTHVHTYPHIYTHLHTIGHICTHICTHMHTYVDICVHMCTQKKIQNGGL